MIFGVVDTSSTPKNFPSFFPPPTGTRNNYPDVKVKRFCGDEDQLISFTSPSVM